MKIFDTDGRERDWNWVASKYNLPEIDRAIGELDHWEVVELREAIGPASMTVRIIPAMHDEVDIAAIVFGWPDGNVVQAVGTNSQTGFGMGGGAYYRPDRGETGPHYVKVLGISDIVNGLGMIGRTNHAHLEPTFQFVKASPGEPPEEDNWKEKYEYMQTLYEVLLMEYNLLVDGLKEIRQSADELIPRG